MSTIGGRLKEERARLHLTQEAFGGVGGVGKHAQINYEKGERSPDGDYFARIAERGVDIMYVITGQRVYLELKQTQAEYANPARQLAAYISAMQLSQEDADLVLSIARRFDASPGTAGRTRLEIPATADNAKPPHEIERRAPRPGRRVSDEG